MTTVNEVLQSQIGTKFHGVQAIVKEVHKRVSGVTNNRNWSLQTLVLQGSNMNLKCTFWGRDEIPRAWAGREILIEATNDKGGGIGLKDDSYADKQSGEQIDQVCLQVEKNANVVHESQYGTERPGQAHPAPNQEHPPQGDQRFPDETRQSASTRGQVPPDRQRPPSGGENHYKQNTTQASDSQEEKPNQLKAQTNQCIKAARCWYKILKNNHDMRMQLEGEGITITDEHFHGLCTTTFISLDRQGQVFVG